MYDRSLIVATTDKLDFPKAFEPRYKSFLLTGFFIWNDKKRISEVNYGCE